jgi:hypothetical protein
VEAGTVDMFGTSVVLGCAFAVVLMEGTDVVGTITEVSAERVKKS